MNHPTLVVHLDSGSRCAARIALAANLAKVCGSHLVGVVGTGIPDIVLTLNSAVPDSFDLVALTSAHLRSRAEASAAAFAAQARSLGVASFESLVVEEEAVDATVAHARTSDLVIVGQADWQEPVDGIARDFPQQVLIHAGTPVLLVPFAGNFATIGEHVLVAWKDTREAARAIRDALPFLHGAKRVTLLEIDERDGDAPGGSPSLGAACGWLQRHGIAVASRCEPRTADVGDAILSRACALSADLIVMGAYGHSRAREWVLGGATRHLLRHMTVPTLMSH